MKRASIDLGTNTCLLLIQDQSESQEIVLHDESTVVRLGQGVDQAGALSPEAMTRALDCIYRYAKIAQQFGVSPDKIKAVGTASSRDAKNSKAFYERVQKETGVQFAILSGDEEARATFLGAALPGMDPQSMVVMDIGGGSTELVAIPHGKTLLGQSLNVGAVRMTERYLKSNPVTDDEFWSAEDAINEALQSMKSWRKDLESKIGNPTFVAVAGTSVTLALLQLGLLNFDRKQIDGLRISRGDAHRWVEELKWRTVQERQAMLGMEPKRADVILAGALIFWRVMEELNFQEALISTRGLRYGIWNL